MRTWKERKGKETFHHLLPSHFICCLLRGSCKIIARKFTGRKRIIDNCTSKKDGLPLYVRDEFEIDWKCWRIFKFLNFIHTHLQYKMSVLITGSRYAYTTHANSLFQWNIRIKWRMYMLKSKRGIKAWN